MASHRVILIVADGWGVAPPGPGNYIEQANTPTIDSYTKNYPYTTLRASGNAVGVPEGAQGNSEVGHLHIGAGRVVWQMFTLVNKAIEDESLFTRDNYKKAIETVKQNKSALHILGMFSDEGIHAHIAHAKAIMEHAKKEGIEKIYIHFIADGRDVPEKSAKKYVKELEKFGIGTIATIVGRYYAMDRDHNWDRTKAAYDLLTDAKGFTAHSAEEAVDAAYARGDKTDYYIQPTVLLDTNNQPVATLADNDVVIFFNFRTDRPRQLSHALVDEKFDGFERNSHPHISLFTMTPYDDTLENNAILQFKENPVENNLASVIAQHHMKQLRLAETDKYPHVTYFFNSEIETPFPGEERIMIPSAKVPSYDMQPTMSAEGITTTALEKIDENIYGFMLINFANGDLVGHTAIRDAIITGVETVDACVKKIVDAALKNDYVVFFTADHGNAEDALYPNGDPKPSHSTNPVPFIVITNDTELEKARLRSGGALTDIAPTIIDVMGIEKPSEMTGSSLIEK